MIPAMRVFFQNPLQDGLQFSSALLQDQESLGTTCHFNSVTMNLKLALLIAILSVGGISSLYTSSRQYVHTCGQLGATEGDVGCVLPHKDARWDESQWVTCVPLDYCRMYKKYVHNESPWSCLREGYHSHFADISLGSGGELVELFCSAEEVGRVTLGRGVEKCRCTTVGQAPNRHYDAQCNIPDGSDCDWYEQCLDSRYGCSTSQHRYPLLYGKHFCRVTKQNEAKFSDVGRAWNQNVRRCLQISLVRLIKPWMSESCRMVQRVAFESHAPCYTSSPSICELPCKDLMTIMFMVFGPPGFTRVTENVMEIFGQMVDTAAICLTRISLDSPGECGASLINLGLTVYSLGEHTATSIVNHLNAIVAHVRKILGDLFSWPFQSLAFAQPDNNRQRRTAINNASHTEVTMRLLLSNQRIPVQLGNVTATTSVPPDPATTSMPQDTQMAFEKAVKELAATVRTSAALQDIHMVLNGSLVQVKVTSLNQCSDVACKTTVPQYTDVRPEQQEGSGGA